MQEQELFMASMQNTASMVSILHLGQSGQYFFCSVLSSKSVFTMSLWILNSPNNPSSGC